MKAATVTEIKRELKTKSEQELVELCLHLSKFKKENKELLTYLLYEKEDEEAYILSVKGEVDEDFELINTQSYYFIKKSVRKILRKIKKYIRYSKQKQTEIELLIYFCEKLKALSPSISKSQALVNIYDRQLVMAKKTIDKLHEDLQYDYNLTLSNLSDQL